MMIRGIVFALFFLSGALGLVYEITWMRQFRVIMGNTVYTSATVLTAFMGGLALGSFVAARIVDRVRRPLRAYGILELLYLLVLEGQAQVSISDHQVQLPPRAALRARRRTLVDRYTALV